MPDELPEEAAAARARPDDVSAQIAAAWACDSAGHEEEAVRFYDAAWKLGVPASVEAEFIVGYGSTLRNVGRIADSVALLEGYLREHPDNHAARCFHGLALHSLGRGGAALAELLEVAVALHGASPHLTRYRRALGEYRDQLRAEQPPLPKSGEGRPG
ncbi:MAG: tetratricopeptide repeat protein [Archangiaceae bacterium]|nr:tetratricopeptide repeat protein [Archangiaceae bacterium]